MRVVRIIPPETENKFALVKCLGTKVQLPDGSFLPGVTRVELIAEVDGVWRAVIHCHAAPPEISVLAEVRTMKSLPKWKCLILRMVGVRYVDDTCLTDRYRHTRNVPRIWPWQRRKQKS